MVFTSRFYGGLITIAFLERCEMAHHIICFDTFCVKRKSNCSYMSKTPYCSNLYVCACMRTFLNTSTLQT